MVATSRDPSLTGLVSAVAEATLPSIGFEPGTHSGDWGLRLLMEQDWDDRNGEDGVRGPGESKRDGWKRELLT